jgi:hypothetical protein
VFENALDGRQRRGLHGSQPGDAVGKFLHEAALGVVALLRAKLLAQRAGERFDGGITTHEGAVAFEAVEPHFGAHAGRVCDGVRGAGEQVGEGNGLTQLLGQRFEREVERARHRRQQAGRRVRVRGGIRRTSVCQ